MLPRLGLSLRWDGAGFGGAVPVYGVDRLVPQGIEDPWKAAGQVAGNADLVFCSSADPPTPPRCQQRRPLPVSHSNGIDHPGIALRSSSRSCGHVLPSVLAVILTAENGKFKLTVSSKG